MALSIYQLKPAFVALLRPVAAALYSRGITANQITLLVALLSVAYGALLCIFPTSAFVWLGLPLWFFVRMALNAIDGILAREFKLKSRLGALLNECGDVAADAALFIPLALVPNVSGWLVGAFVWLALGTEFAGVLGLLIGAERCYDGPLGKSDRAFLISLAALLTGFSLLYAFSPAAILNAVLGLASALMLLTVYNRLRHALHHQQNSPYTS